MKTTRFFLLGGVVLSLLGGAYFVLFQKSTTSASSPDALLDIDESPGTPEDPTARARFEWMRLRDPATGVIPPNIRTREFAFASRLPARENPASARRRNQESTGGIQSINWTRRGPYNIGGRTRALAVDIADPDILLAGGVSGGMWRSLDGGASWIRATDISALQSVTCIAQDTRAGKTDTWYYGTGEYIGNSAGFVGSADVGYMGDGIFKSTNNGASWTQLSSTVSGSPQSDHPFAYVWSICVDPSVTMQDVVYAAAYGAVYRSTDGGTSWNVVLASANSGYTELALTSTTPAGEARTSVAPLNVDAPKDAHAAMYATFSSDGSAPGIFRSFDGTNWTQITPVGWPGAYLRTVIGVAPSNPDIVYFYSCTPSNGKNDCSLWRYTYVSGDGSGSDGVWANLSANLPADIECYGSYNMLVRVKPDDQNVVFVGGTNLYRSVEGYSEPYTAERIGGYAITNQHPDEHVVVFSPTDPSVLYSGNDGGVFKTTNDLASPVVWTSLNNGYFTTQFYSVAIDHSTTASDVVIGGMQDNGSVFTNTLNSDAPWSTPIGGDGTSCAIASGRSSYYMSTQYGHVYRVLPDDNGNPGLHTRVDPVGGSGYEFISPFTLDPYNSDMMYFAAGSSLWRNNGLSAIPMNSELRTTVNWTKITDTVVTGHISALGISTGGPANRLYYGTNEGSVFRLDEADTGNPSPTDVWTGKGFPSGAYVSCVAVDPGNGSNAMVVFSNYSVVSLYYTTDAGSTWSAVAGNLEQNPDGTGSGPSCRWAVIFPFGGLTNYLVGTSVGIFSTTALNGSSTLWSQEGTSSIGSTVVDMIDVRPSDGLVVVGTHGNGVFSAYLTGPLSVYPDQRVPLAFALDQNYPNPFNPTTTIRYELPRRSQVNMAVFDVAGRQVATLVDGEQETGYHDVRLDGSNLASGVYFYRIQAGSFVQTRKLLLIK